MSQDVHVVLYTDGSARPNPGFVGWGCHGYIYDQTLTEYKKDKPHYCTTTGYVLKDSADLSSGTSQVVNVLTYLDFVGPSDQTASNNWAEIAAVYESILGILSKCQEKEQAVKSWLIFTDSEYVKKGITEYLAVWKRNNWIKFDGSSVKNEELWKKLDLLIQDIQRSGSSFTIKHIMSHRGYLGNTQADYLSVVAMNRSKNNKKSNEAMYDYHDPKKYWRNERPQSVEDRHPLIGFKRIYFNSLAQHNYMGHYYQVESGTKGENKDAMNGKRTSEAAFAVVRLQNPDPIVELLKRKQIQACDGYNLVMAMLLDTISTKEVSGHLEKYDEDCLHVNPRNFNLEFLDRRVLCESLNPSNLTPRSIDMLNFLEKVLENVRHVRHNENIHDIRKIQLQMHDITQIFFDTNEKGKTKLKKEFGVGIKSTSCSFSFTDGNANRHDLKAPIALGLDMPDRNALSKLSSMEPRLYLVYWLDSATALSYSVYVECSDGYGLWANAFSNKIYVPDSTSSS